MTVSRLPKHTLHPEALTVSFRFRHALSKIFCDVLYLNCIDYISVNIVNPDGQILCFSSCPGFEHNFFRDPLSELDHSFSPVFYKNNVYYSWTDAFDESNQQPLEALKLKKYDFKYGCCFTRQLDGFFLIYSIASKNVDANKQYYLDHADDILQIGDFCYRKIKPLYNLVSSQKIAPITSIFSCFRKSLMQSENNRPIIYFGDERLNRQSEEVDFDYLKSAEYHEIKKQLLNHHQSTGAIGFAAPQMGVNKKIIVIGVTKNTVRKVAFNFPIQILINPTIIAHSDITEEGREGCLSLPNIIVDVPRYTHITVSHMNIEDGSTRTFEATGLVAKVLQHEIDHLSGINFLSRSKNLNSILYTKKMVKIND